MADLNLRTLCRLGGRFVGAYVFGGVALLLASSASLRGAGIGSSHARVMMSGTAGAPAEAGSNAVLLTRGPYLQMQTPTKVTVRWRTSEPTDSRVQWGLAADHLDNVINVSTVTNEHKVRITGLLPDTLYYYSVGTTQRVLGSGPGYFCVTPPTNAKPTRIWVTGDTRTGDANQLAVRDAYYQFTGSRPTDVWLTLGDNGGPTGADAEYQVVFFECFRRVLRQSGVWPSIGNHETYHNPAHFAYLDLFTLPQRGQAGGVPSGSDRYYSFNYGAIHFVALDSVTSDISSNGAMHAWLAADLAANRQDWLIAYWHYPPYSKGSHDSDSEEGLIQMRRNFLPLLEAYGVDLVLAGHSHNYERSYLLDGHYGSSTALSTRMILDSGDGRPSGSGAYVKAARGPTPHQGTVCVVMGSSGLVSPGPLGHPAMCYSANALGSLVLDIDGDTLKARFLRETGMVDDSFTLIKNPALLAPRVTFVGWRDGQVTLRWTTVPGAFYQVLRRRSFDLPWVGVSGILPGVGAVLEWTDPNPKRRPVGFYQVEKLPQ